MPLHAWSRDRSNGQTRVATTFGIAHASPSGCILSRMHCTVPFATQKSTQCGPSDQRKIRNERKTHFTWEILGRNLDKIISWWKKNIYTFNAHVPNYVVQNPCFENPCPAKKLARLWWSDGDPPLVFCHAFQVSMRISMMHDVHQFNGASPCFTNSKLPGKGWSSSEHEIHGDKLVPQVKVTHDFWKCCHHWNQVVILTSWKVKLESLDILDSLESSFCKLETMFTRSYWKKKHTLNLEEKPRSTKITLTVFTSNWGSATGSISLVGEMMLEIIWPLIADNLSTERIRDPRCHIGWPDPRRIWVWTNPLFAPGNWRARFLFNFQGGNGYFWMYVKVCKSVWAHMLLSLMLLNA